MTPKNVAIERLLRFQVLAMNADVAESCNSHGVCSDEVKEKPRRSGVKW